MLTIRPTIPEDLTKLSELWFEQTSLLGQVDSRLVPPVDAAKTWRLAVENSLSDPRSVCITAVDDRDQILGGGIGWEAPVGLLPGVVTRTGVIGDIIIDMHQYQGGTARQIVNGIRAAFERQDVHQFVAINPNRNVTGQAFWRAYGAVEWMDCFWIRRNN